MSHDTASERGLEIGHAGAPRPQFGKAAENHSFPPGTKRFPLTIAQTPIAVDAIALPNLPVANTGDIAHIHGHVDSQQFAAACRRVVAETAAIRVSLVYRDGLLLQEFPDLDDYVLEQHDFSASKQPEVLVAAWIEEYFWTPRVWNSFPLFQFALLKIRDDHFVFLQKFHHVLADAIGRFQCFRRIACVYDALIQGLTPGFSETPPLTIRIAEEAAYLSSSAYEADLAYWTSRLDGLPQPLVEVDRSKSERARSGRSKHISQAIAPDDFARLRKAAASQGSSVPKLVLAMTYIGISRLYGVTDIVIGTPMHNRTAHAARRAIDLAMTVMPFRMKLDANTTIAKLLKEIAVAQVADRRRSRFPVAFLTRSNGQRGTVSAIFDVIVNYIPAMELTSLAGAKVTYSNYSSGFYSPWGIDIRETNDGLGAALIVAFDTGLIETDEADRLTRCLCFLLKNPIDLSQQTVGGIPVMSDAERQHLLVEMNDNCMPVPDDATLASLCARQAALTPDALAVTYETQSITYRELHARAEVVALHLSQAGVGPEVIVGVALPRDIELIVALLAIIKAGGAYLPLDPALPPDRVAYMLSDAKARFILTTRARRESLPQTDATCIMLDDPALGVPGVGIFPLELAAVSPENLAYVIYTSGSTGLPKGVAVEHRNVVNLVLCLASLLQPRDRDGILFSSSLSFDASIDQIFLSLTCGGRLIVVETLLALPFAPARNEVRVMETAPSVFDALLQVGGFHRGVGLIRFGGEPLPRALVERVLAIDPNVRIENLYGPTETTVDATICVIRHDDGAEPTIGKGIWNTKLYVLDQNRELLPKGARGELYIGGAGVARGYLNKPELSAERFVKNLFGEGRLYRTGDIVRWRENGDLDFLHRTDAQVKINGVRIELGEIERQLEAMPEILSAVAIVRPDGQGVERIFAFAISRDRNSTPAISAVNGHLLGKLPRYMMPAALRWVEKFPLTPSGKLDSNALPLPAWGSSQDSYRQPSNSDEASLVSIWSQVLNISKIGIDDDFFEMGGTSLQAIMIFARIARDHGLDLPAFTMISAPTIAQQAALLKGAPRAYGGALLVGFREKGDGLPLFFVHGGGGGVMYVRNIMQDLRCKNPLYALQPPPLDGTRSLPRSIEEFAAAYLEEILKVQPAGPFQIIGYSSGGMIAFEMAQQLNRAGKTVGFLGLIEAYPRRFRDPILKRALARVGSYHGGTSRDTFALHIAKRIVRKCVVYLVAMQIIARELINELRLSLGIAIRYNDRHDFYGRRFSTAVTAYVPRQYPGAVTLFVRKIKAAPYRAKWSTLAGGGLLVREVPVTTHPELIDLPSSRFLAKHIDSCVTELGCDELAIGAQPEGSR